jgi:hypothetical protein
MRGDVHCRAHRDAELGPRGGGAPTGNLNALKTGEDAHPLGRSAINRFALLIMTDPDCLPDLLADLARDIQARTEDIDQTLAALSAILRYLVPSVADARFSAELDALLLQVPPEMRPKLQVTVWKHALRYPPHQKVALLRGVAAQVLAGLKKPSTGKTTPGT